MTNNNISEIGQTSPLWTIPNCRTSSQAWTQYSPKTPHPGYHIITQVGHSKPTMIHHGQQHHKEDLNHKDHNPIQNKQPAYLIYFNLHKYHLGCWSLCLSLSLLLPIMANLGRLDTQAILLAILSALQDILVKGLQQANFHVFGALLEVLHKWDKVLEIGLGFQIFLGLVQVKLMETLSQPFHSVIKYFPTFVSELSILELKIKDNERHFKIVRQLLNSGVHILSFCQTNKIPQNLQSYLTTTQQTEPSQQKLTQFQECPKTDSETVQSFYKTISKFLLIDPQVRLFVLKLIKQLFKQGLESEHCCKLIKMCCELNHKKIFQNYDIEIFHEILEIKKYLRSHNYSLFNSMIFLILDKPTPEMLKLHKKYLLKFCANEETAIFLFSLYYHLIFGEDANYFDEEVFNTLVMWNVKFGMMPAQNFIPNIIKMGLDKLDENSEKVICSSKRQGWPGLALMIVQNKCRDYVSGKLNLHSTPTNQIFNTCTQIYTIYCKMFIQVLTNIASQKLCTSTSTPQTITIQVQYLSYTQSTSQTICKIRQHTIIILNKALENNIQDCYFLENFVLLGCLGDLGDLGVEGRLRFFVAGITKMGDLEVYGFIGFCAKFFPVFKNSYLLFLILISAIQVFTTRKDSQMLKDKVIIILTDVCNMTGNDGFTKLASYHHRNLQLLIILSYISNQERVLKKCHQIIGNWGTVYSKADIDQILYQFDKSLLSQLLPILCCSFNPQQQIQHYIMSSLHQILTLLLQSPCKTTKYLTPFKNTIHFIPIRHSNQKNSINIQLKMLINTRFCCNSALQIYATPRKDQGGIQKYRIGFKNKKIIFYNRIKKNIQNHIEISESLYSKPFSLDIQVANEKLIVLINKTELVNRKWDYLIDNLKFDLNGDIMIKDFRWQRFEQGYHELKFTQNFQIFPSQAEIKLQRIDHLPIMSFQDKITTSQLCIYLTALFANNVNIIPPNKYYHLCCDIILHKEGSLNNQYSEVEFAVVRRLFRDLLKLSQRAKITLPERAIMNLNIGSKRCYQFLAACTINQPFLSQCGPQHQLKALSYLNELMFGKQMDFRIGIENRKMRIFANLVKSTLKMVPEIAGKYLQLLEKIIMTHETNQKLLKKITFLFYIVNSTKSQMLIKFYDCLMQKIFAVSNHNQNQSNYHVKLICKYFLSSHKNLKQIFVMANKDIKTKILDSMIDDEQIYERCHTLFQGIPPSQFLELSSWLIVYCKRTMFYFFDNKKRSKHNLSNLMFFLRQISIAIRVQTDADHRQQFLSILLSFLKKSLKIFDEKPSQLIIEQIQNFYSDENLIKLLGDKIANYTNQQIKDKNKQNFISLYFDNLFNYLPKFVILKALQEFRKLGQVYYQCFVFIINLDYINILPVKSLSPFLQYIIQIIIKLKESVEVGKLAELGILLKQYLEKMIKNYHNATKMRSPLLYCFPKMERKIQFEDTSFVKRVVQKVKVVKDYELSGGIYFKLMLTTLYLIQILPNENFGQLMELFLEKIGEKSKAQPIFRAVTDFIQVSKETKKRSSIDIAIQEAHKQHEKYFEEEDTKLLSYSPIKRKSSKVDIDTDLTPFFIDYFFMKMFIFLEKYSEENVDESILKVCETYSKLILRYLKVFEHISHEMSEINEKSIVKFETVEDLYNLFIDEEPQQATNHEIILSPAVSSRRISNGSNIKFEFGNQQFDKAFISPTKPLSKSRTHINFDLNNGKKKIKPLISNLEQNIYNWSKEARKKKAHRFFRDQSKEILFTELLHQYFVLESEASNLLKQAQITKGKRLMGFLSNEGAEFVEEHILREEEWIKLLEDIRKVHKFTYIAKPQLQIDQKVFPNLTHPFTTLPSISVEQYQQNNPEMSFRGGTFLNQFELFHNSPYLNIETIVCLAEDPNYCESDCICEISTPTGVYFCSWEFKNKNIVFTSKAEKSVKGQLNQRIIKYGSPICNIIRQDGHKFQIVPNDVLEIFYRKYNQVKNNSLEFFKKDGSSIYVIFFTEERAKKFIKQCKAKINQFQLINIVENYVKVFQSQQYTEKWVSGEISNFDYLMLINKYSGRSYCDLNQYYIFPWVLEDYTSSYIDISSSKAYRDLKKPIGALRKQKLDRYMEKLLNLGDREADKYLYGSHYSTSLFVFYYLVRLEPFTSLHKDMQGGDYDAPDRLFSSMQQMWECLMSESSTSDIKESIPEFYYFPTFLKNINNLSLGKKQSGTVVSHVELPPWSSSAADFILKMRAYLESDYVSLHLNEWIDLIFGKDQKSIEKFNVFHPLSYMENVNPEKIEFENLDAIMSQITFFGQNPCVLFTKQHPKKKTKLSPNSRTSNNNFNIDLQLNPFENLNRMHEEQNLDLIYYVSSMSFKCKNIILMKISGISKSLPTRNIDLDMDNSVHSLIRTIQKMDNPSMKRLLSQNNIELPEQKLQSNCIVDNDQIIISVGVTRQKQIIKKLKINYQFQKVQYNQIVIVVYGAKGLRVYDWDLDILWDNSDQDQVSECFLDPGLLFFATSNGKLYCYDFLSNFKQLVFQYTKPTFSIDMLVYPQRKIITKKNEISYKFVLVGDKRKIMLLHYTHGMGKIQVKQ